MAIQIRQTNASIFNQHLDDETPPERTDMTSAPPVDSTSIPGIFSSDRIDMTTTPPIVPTSVPVVSISDMSSISYNALPPLNVLSRWS
jgi:hypothetical protein